MIAPIDITDIRIETPRLILRPWRESDLQDFYEYARVDGVGQMAGWRPHESMDETKTILQMFLEGRETLAMELKESGKVIGSVGLKEHEDCPAIAQTLQGREVGYALGKPYWGKGLMPEAVGALCHYCFSALHYDYLTCGHFNFNAQSRRVVEKCGFSYLEEHIFETRMGTQELGRYYVLYNPNKVR